ncbi:MAG: OmpA family protein [Hyphomicrobium sp.]|uniref:OmpA family protein n=1 Tax=Hyphomicrobium sp. TaxID=82 RepID=UPI003D125521
MVLLSFRSKAFSSGVIAALAFTLSTAALGPAFADDAPSVQEIIEALKPRKTRGLSVKPTPAEIERAKTIEDLKSKAQSGGLSDPERQQLAEAASDKPSLDFVIYFDFGSAQISSRSRASLDALGAALQDDSLKGSSIMVAGHTDAKGGADFNRGLSERRAQAVREYLHAKFGIDEGTVTVVGYGAEQLKDKAAPYASVNRRVQIVNLTDKTASARRPVSDQGP